MAITVVGNSAQNISGVNAKSVAIKYGFKMYQNGDSINGFLIQKKVSQDDLTDFTKELKFRCEEL